MYGHQWASYQIPIIAGCACPRMSGAFSPPLWVSDPDKHHGTFVTHVPWCMPGSLTSRFLWRRLRGKRSRYSLHMRNPPFYVSGKRPIICYNAHCHDIWDIWKHKQHHYRLHIFPQRKKMGDSCETLWGETATILRKLQGKGSALYTPAWHIHGLVQDCSKKSIANAMALLWACTKPSIYVNRFDDLSAFW